MSEELDFTGRTILVTGSGRNIGRAIILEFARRGANVVINARSNKDEAAAVEEEARRLGAGTLVVMGDASERSTIDEIKVRAEEKFGRVDMYVSNAATRLYKTFFEIDDEDWHYYLNQQLSSAWYLAKAFVPGMREAGWGRIIHINGNDGVRGGWERIPHSVAKGGLRTLTRSLASGLGEFGITVNEIYPGFVATERDPKTHPEVTDDHTARRLSRLPLRRQPRPDELAWACAFLCSPRSGAITSASLSLDGGEMWVQAR
ncbi:SDR family oxidoreductase [Amycolatopsis acidicola]|uniref:SDR family oxidoreductase n=1 Tax=Amycolatopsis acidicola TaxID=2596893 RepID=A0A5N0UWY7_9PSEU|nr:SDR family oxidoreductase [Amycolatopsis acidicola]KAA9157791.1 SDR family oxidoreductase [Amycolatopsis acidicola]